MAVGTGKDLCPVSAVPSVAGGRVITTTSWPHMSVVRTNCPNTNKALETEGTQKSIINISGHHDQSPNNLKLQGYKL